MEETNAEAARRIERMVKTSLPACRNQVAELERRSALGWGYIDQLILTSMPAPEAGTGQR